MPMSDGPSRPLGSGGDVASVVSMRTPLTRAQLGKLRVEPGSTLGRNIDSRAGLRPAVRLERRFSMPLRKTWVTGILALGLLVLLSNGRLAADTIAVLGFGEAYWFGTKMKAKDTPMLVVNVEIPLEGFPPGAEVGVEMSCETGAFKDDGFSKPAKKVKGTARSFFWTTNPVAVVDGLDNREPLGTVFGARYITGADGIARWQDRVPIPDPSNPPQNVGVQVQVKPKNSKKVRSTGAACDLKSVVVIAGQPPEE